MADRGMSEDNPENDRELESGEIPQGFHGPAAPYHKALP